MTSIKRLQLTPLTDAEEARIKKQIAQDPDNPEASDEELRNARPFKEVLPDLHAAIVAHIATEKEFEPGHGYTKEDWDAVSDNPEWTEEDIRNAKPMREALPDLHAALVAEIEARARKR